MFLGLYLVDTKQYSQEHYPIGTAVTIPTNSGSLHGYVLAVPNPPPSSTIHSDPIYTIQYLNSGTTIVPALVMESFINQSPYPIQITLPSWLIHDS